MRCYSCDAAAALSPGERVGFRDECEACRADLHVCLNCAHHDPDTYNECRESSAERVADRDRGNRCEYFAPGEGKGGGPSADRTTAMSELESLFKKS